MTQSASVVVGRPLSMIESQFWPVTNWASCLSDVASIRRSGHERYAVELRTGRRLEEVLVAVRWNARHHRFTWKALEGPQWTGELRMAPVNGRRTRLHLELSTMPRTLLGGFAELLGLTRPDLSADLARIHDLVNALPEPVRPSRLMVGVPVPQPVVDTLAAAPARSEVEAWTERVPVPVPAALAMVPAQREPLTADAY